MALIQWESLRDIEDLLNRYTRSIPRAGGGGSPSLSAMAEWNPRVDISENESSYVLQADIPGVAKEDLKVTVDNGVLTLQGERRQEQKQDEEHFHRVERFYGSFSRSFHLPEDADPAGLKASAADGQLTVTVPKKALAPSPSTVQVPVE
jgi:HSP20 family protein